MVSLTRQTADAAGPSRAVVLSTDHLPVAARAEYWRRAIGVPFPGLAIDWLSNEPIRAQCESRVFADGRVTALSNTPVRVEHHPPQSGTGDYQLALHLSGNGSYSHNGREVIQDEGDLVLLDTALPFVSRFGVGFRLLVWNLPRPMLEPLLAAPERAVAIRISGCVGLGNLLGVHARALAAEAGRLDTATQRHLQMHLCYLTALALGAAAELRDARQVAYRAARRQQILAYIEAHFRDEGVSAERAARDLRMSRRWLHALLEGSGAGFAARIAARRVEACRAILEDPAQDDLSIAEIAFRGGFADISTFNRRFRARYGIAPREARRNRPCPDG